MKYSEFIQLLTENAEESFAEFQRKLIPTKQKILGVRTPIMRKIAKQLQGLEEEVFAYPDEIYEVTFIKLTLVSMLPYDKFLLYIEDCVSKMDNWATCDSFKAKCIKAHKKEYLNVLEKIFCHGGEFYERYVLVALLNDYVQDAYITVIVDYLKRADFSYFYVSMAAAWLTAEILIKEYDSGVSILKQGILERKTHNRAIQKAIESFRLTKEQKDYLRSLKK